MTPAWHTIALPDAATAVAKVAATLAGLGSGAYDGQKGIVRPASVTDGDEAILHWNAADAKWRGRPIHLFGQTDQIYMGTNSAAYSYVGTDTTGATAAQIGVYTSALQNAYDFLNAGLKLEHRWQTVLRGAPAIATAILYFFANDDGETVVFSADGSAAVGESAALASANTSTPIFKRQPWSPVSKRGSVGVALAASDLTVSHRNLWPRLYMKVASGLNFGGIIDTALDVRWAS